MAGNESSSNSCVKREPHEDGTHTPYEHSFYTKTVPGLGLEALAPAAPAAVPVPAGPGPGPGPAEPRAAATLATLQAAPLSQTCSLLERHRSLTSQNNQDDEYAPYTIKEEPSEEPEPGSSDDASPASPTSPASPLGSKSPKAWTSQDMEKALQALRSHSMSLTKASATYGIPSTTLWQRAHRLGIDTPKKDGSGGAKAWGSADLRRALHALRAGAISANKASKAYGIPSSTLYKIARREGIRLAAPFNAAPTAWTRSELARALDAIRCGAASVQGAAAQYGIPTGTLYGRCKREGIELSRSNPAPWSERAMGEALEAVRVGQMSINQAAIHYNLPYSSLYGRFKRIKQVNQPQDYAETHPSEPEPAGAKLPTSHSTHPEIAYLNQSVQNIHQSPHSIDQIHSSDLQGNHRSLTAHLVGQGLSAPQGLLRIDQGSPSPHLIGQGLQRIDQGSPSPHLIGQGLQRIEQGLGLNSPVPNNNQTSTMHSVSQLRSLSNHGLQSETHDKGLQSPVIQQDNQRLNVPISKRISQGLNSTTPLVSQGLNSPAPVVSQPQQGLQEIDQGLNPPNLGLQTLHPVVFNQYEQQYPSEFSLYYQSCNLAS